MIGDGQSTTLTVDLRKEPFGIGFSGNFPRAIFLRVADGERPNYTIDGSGVITLTYQKPIGPPMEGSLSPRSQLEIVLLYGPSVEEKKAKS